MKRRFKRTVAVILVLMLILTQFSVVNGSTGDKLASGEDKSAIKESGQADIVPGKMLVKYKSNTSSATKSSLNASVSAVSERSDKKLGITELELPEDADVLAAAEKLNSDPNVVFAEPVYRRKAFATAPEDTVVESVYCSDEFYKKGWQWGLQAVNMEELWGEAAAEAQADIVIAVIDTGVDADNPEFDNKIVAGYDFVNNDNDPDDDYGHGTHVAGIAAAGNDGSGMGGVAPGARIMPIKILDENGFGDTVTEINGILYAVNNGADVINLSIGGSGRSYGEQLAIEYAIKRGVVVVAAAGNDSDSSVDYPARYEGVISVAAVDWNSGEFEMADFSNYGNDIDIVAPGAEILSTIPEELDSIGSGIGDSRADGYALMSGTSMATPFVAGMAAMLLAKGGAIDTESELSVCDQVLQIMQEQAVEFEYDGYGYKLLNGSSGKANTLPIFRQLMLKASPAKDENGVKLNLSGSNYRNEASEALEGSFKVYMVPFTMDEYGNRSLGDPEEAGTIDVADGAGSTTIDVVERYNFLFFAEGNDEYLDSERVKCKENNDSFDNAAELELGRPIYSAIDEVGEHDYYKFTTPAGSEAVEYAIEAMGDMDNYGCLYDAAFELIDENDDSGEGLNFGIVQSLQPAATYYVRIEDLGDDNTGYYGLVVEEAKEGATVEITGTISLPGSDTAKGDISGEICLIEKYWDYETEEYSYYNTDADEFVISDGASSAGYTLAVDSGSDYIVAYRLNIAESNSEYVPAAFYKKEGTVMGIDSADIITGTQTADIKVIEKASIEISSAAYDTKDTAGELELDKNAAVKMDYPGDIDYYHIGITEPGRYMVSLMQDINNSMGISAKITDSEGNLIENAKPEYIYKDDELVGISGITEFAAGDYYLVVHADVEYIVERYDFFFNPWETQQAIGKATEISCTMTLPAEMDRYYGEFYLLDNSGIGYAVAKRIEPGDSDVSLFVPYSSDSSYVLGYASQMNIKYRSGQDMTSDLQPYKVDDDRAYDEMGYYSYDTESKSGTTVADIVAATPLYADKDTALEFEVKRITDTSNDSMAAAAVLTANTAAKGIINNGIDADYFKFTAPGKGTYTLSFEGKTEQRILKGGYYREPLLGLLLYENGKWVRYAEGIKTSMTKQLPAGTYYVQLIGNGYYLGKYELALKYSLDSSKDDDDDDSHSGRGGSGSTASTGNPKGSESTASGSATITKGGDGRTTAAVSVDAAKLAAALKAPGTAPVMVDVKTSTATDMVNVSIPSSILSEADRLQNTLVIASNNVSFEIQPGTINTGGLNGDLRLEINQLTLDAVPEEYRNKDAAADEVSMVFDFGMYLGDQKITDFSKPITITVKFDPSKVVDSSKLGVYYYNEKDGSWEYVGGKVNEDGTITFIVEHFSKYVVMEFKKTFEDIKTHWAKQDIEVILSRQITNGVDLKNFKPDREITRAEFVVMLTRALELKASSGYSFKDVSEKAWYKDYLQKAHKAGIIGGSNFAPEEFINREQMAEMLVKAYSYSSGKRTEDMRTTQQMRFKDERMAEPEAKDSIILADALGLMGGNPDGTFAPKGRATRAEAAATIIRLLKKLDRL